MLDRDAVSLDILLTPVTTVADRHVDTTGLGISVHAPYQSVPTDRYHQLLLCPRRVLYRWEQFLKASPRGDLSPCSCAQSPKSSRSTVQFVGISAFHTQIADPLIGGTYMTVSRPAGEVSKLKSN